jgi:hypothetical protein
MDPIKEAFQKIKEDMFSLRSELLDLKSEISSLRNTIKSQQQAQPIPAIPTQNPAIIPTPTDTSTQNPTVPQEIRGSEMIQTNVSTGNKGVPTDTSTDRQTHQQTIISDRNTLINTSIDIRETLSSLDQIKKELRLKFKRLTHQEMLVFSTLYGLENQGIEEITYRTIATNLNLSESSIRDYISKIYSKGIPVIKTRLNNKKIILNISTDLQKIASLATITRLREL